MTPSWQHERKVARPHLDAFHPDFVLFSYHGLPERHVRKSDPTQKYCLASAGCCDAIGPANQWIDAVAKMVRSTGAAPR